MSLSSLRICWASQPSAWHDAKKVAGERNSRASSADGADADLNGAGLTRPAGSAETGSGAAGAPRPVRAT
eukprot:208110-Prymnesium_polylepis.1